MQPSEGEGDDVEKSAERVQIMCGGEILRTVGPPVHDPFDGRKRLEYFDGQRHAHDASSFQHALSHTLQNLEQHSRLTLYHLRVHAFQLSVLSHFVAREYTLAARSLYFPFIIVARAY